MNKLLIASMNVIQTILILSANLLAAVGGIISLTYGLILMSEIMGFWGIVLGIFMWPVLIPCAPIWMYLNVNEFTPILLTYGLFLLGFIAMLFSMWLTKYDNLEYKNSKPQPQNILIGQMVVHPSFGRGIVLSFEDLENDAIITVQFKNEVKNLLASLANLKLEIDETI